MTALVGSPWWDWGIPKVSESKWWDFPLRSVTAPNRALILCCLCANTLQTLSYHIKFSFLPPFYEGANLSLEKLRGKIGTRTQVCLNPKTTAETIGLYCISLYLCAQQLPLTARCYLGSGKGWLVMVIECVVQTLPIIAAAAAKSLQSCPTLCDPIDGSPPGSPVPGILQARTLEWVAIAFSNA